MIINENTLACNNSQDSTQNFEEAVFSQEILDAFHTYNGKYVAHILSAHEESHVCFIGPEKTGEMVFFPSMILKKTILISFCLKGSLSYDPPF